MALRVAAAQISLGKGSYERAMEAALSLVRAAADRHAQIVCFPEHWLLEYGDRSNESVDSLAEAAQRYGISVVTGANYSNSETGARITSILIGSDGGVIGRQDKVHLFRTEKLVATAGDTYKVLDSKLSRIGITVCYDNVFPEAARTLVLKGAEILFVPSRIVAEGQEPWVLYLRVRALENRVPVVAPNVFHPPRYMGGSVIIDLKPEGTNGVVLPEIVASAGEGERLIVADVDVERARILREERFRDRMPKSYNIER